MHNFLLQQQRRLERALSRREFQLQVMETERRLLGETAEWYSRRCQTGVA
jgi:hypothetical protein